MSDSTAVAPINTRRLHGTASSQVAYGRSWAEDLQKYHAAKATVPWQSEQQHPVKHVTRYEKSREEREYDLILGKFRDAERELQQQQDDVTHRKQSLEHSRAKQLRNVQRFHVIHHSPMYPGARDPKDPEPNRPRPVRRTSNVDYNIVTNQPSSAASSSETNATSPSASLSKARMRDFNILTNKYHRQHDERERNETQAAKHAAAVKFVKTHDFDPVRIRYFDDDKEQAFLVRRHDEQLTHGKDRVSKLPPRERLSEGRLYNILNQDVLNAAEITRFQDAADRALHKMKKTEFEARKRQDGERQLELEDTRCLNRFAHERHSQSFVHGYDPITNESFDGVQSKERVRTRTHAALPAWDVLHHGVLSTTKVSSPTHGAAPSSATAAPQRRSDAAEPDTLRRTNVLILDPKSSSPGVGVRTGGFTS
ncbi:hypothetical protein PINS_up006424 [Pythium insidiosum]|nr:hypothetical protein PINS_up006424 [Pythium insidiosum]